MIGNIANNLGVGSGLNTTQLVTDLANAVRQPKDAALRARETQNTARISALSSASAALTTFGSALRDLLSGSAFAGTPRSSNDSAVGVSLLPGGRPTGSTATVRVQSLATAQVSRSALYPSSNDAIGDGALTISTGSTTLGVAIPNPAATLADVAGAITRAASDAGSSIRARVVTDSMGSRMLISGAEGRDQSFAITPDASTSSGLQSFAASITTVQTANNAVIEIDGTPLSFASNIVDGAIAGLRMTLKSVTGPAAIAPGVTIAADIPADGMKSLLTDFVKAYNDLRSGLNSATAAGASGANGGPLAGDPGVRAMMAALSRMTTQPLGDTGTVRSLSDIGVKTDRNGTLVFDTARYDAAANANPDAIRDLINPAIPSTSRPGLSSLFDAVRTPLQARDGPLEASKRKFEAAQKNFATQRDRIDSDDVRYRDQLNRSFTAMERQLTILKATQSYVEQQISAWNNSKN